MADTQAESMTNPTELLAAGRRHLAVREYSAAVEALANACEALAKEHGDMADQLAEPFLWYGKSLLGLSRQESGVFGDGLPGRDNEGEEDDNDDEEDEDDQENGEEKSEQEQNGDKNGEAEATENSESAPKENGDAEKSQPESTSEDAVPGSSKPADDDAEPGPSNGDANDESIANLENEDDVDNLQLAWEMLDLSRSILLKRVRGAGGAGGAAGARALLAEVHLALGEVALESETYDKAVLDMQSCLELQKELYGGDDRRIAETHYQIGLANSLASNFEEAITHFKNAANILESRIKTLEDPASAAGDATVQKHAAAERGYSVEGEIKELKELLPEIQEKIQDMMDYKAEVRPCACVEETRKMLRDMMTIRRVRETLCPPNGAPPAAGSSTAGSSAAGSLPPGSSTASDKPASNISHLIKRKRKASETEEGSAPKKANT